VEGVSDLARERIVEMLQRPRRPEPVSDIFTVLHTAMEGGRGDAVMFVWGMAEAISFPIMAEMSQVWLGLTHPERMWRRAAMVVAGSVTGVAVTHLLTRSGLQPPAPWTAPEMRAATSRYLSRGPRGYWKQALTGIPVKLFAAESGRSNLPLPSVVLHAAGERAARMTASTAIVNTLGKPLGPITRQHYGTYLATTGVVFATALRGVIRHWQRLKRPGRP